MFLWRVKSIRNILYGTAEMRSELGRAFGGVSIPESEVGIIGL